MYQKELNKIFVDHNLRVSFLSSNTGGGKRNHIELNNFLSETNSKIMYIKSGSTGHAFKGMIYSGGKRINYGIKVTAYPRKKKYGYITNLNRPENVDVVILEILSELSDLTPHLMTPYGSFFSDIKPFTDLQIKKNKKFDEFKENYQNNVYHNKVSILLSEWAYRGDLHEYMKETIVKNKTLDPRFFKVVLFQLIYTLAVIHKKYPSFRHNDLKLNNILVQKSVGKKKKRMQYTFDESLVFEVPDIGIMIKLWDFDFASIDGVVHNLKILNKWTQNINIKPTQNQYYDIHFFINTLLKTSVFHQFLEKNMVEEDVLAFIDDVVPEELREHSDNNTVSGRLMTDVQHMTPHDILRNNRFFDEFRGVV